MFFYEAFWELSSDREMGMSVGQLPAASIDRFAAKHGMNVDEEDFFRAVLRGLDNIYLNHQSKKPSDDDNIADFATMDDAAGVSAILKRNARKPAASTG